MSTSLESKENDFVLKIIRLLDENASNIPPVEVDKLAAVRRTAIARKKPEKVAVAAPAFTPVLAGAGASLSLGGGDNTHTRKGLIAKLGGLGLIWPLAALVIGIAGIAYWEDQQRKAELADIDAAMMSDSLPLDAYLDHGFNAYLSRDH
ncbi:putative transmembrane protein [Candidatus Burkholderia brachyanthoides]|nr:putative transmembrane protein [Candidatus Burkholderia brachyanthoides]